MTVPSERLGYLTDFRLEYLKRIRNRTSHVWTNLLMPEVTGRNYEKQVGEPDSWRRLQECAAAVVEADAAINAEALRGVVGPNVIVTSSVVIWERGEVIDKNPELWKTYVEAQRQFFEVSLEVDQWVEVTAYCLASWGLDATTPAEMMAVDGWLGGLEAAVYGDPEARRALEEQRQYHRRGADITNKRREQKYAVRDVELRKRYDLLVKQGLQEMRSERDAQANAVKTLAREENLTKKRIREILAG